MSGRYTYICEDCNERQLLTRAKRANRFRPRCKFCGSLHLVPVNKNMVEERRTQHDITLRERKEKFNRRQRKY